MFAGKKVPVVEVTLVESKLLEALEVTAWTDLHVLLNNDFHAALAPL